MADLGTNNPQGAPTAPPPPSEVKVRTMRSDLESMAKSGGGLPQFENVRIAGLSMERTVAANAAAAARVGGSADPNAVSAAGAAGTPDTKKTHTTIISLMVIAIIAILGILGWFAYQIFFAGSAAAPGSGTPTAQNQGNTPSPAASSTAAGSTAPFIHTTLFKKPADQTLILTLSSLGTAASAADLQTFNQKLSALLASADKAANLIEVAVRTADGRGVAIGDLLTQANAAVLDPAYLAAHFNPDVTLFVYQDKNGGFWPGYVLSLKPGENWLFLKDGVAKLESSPNIANFFLADVDSLSVGGFTDSSVSSTAVRISGPFTYGWYQTYLILSTSQNGFAQAMGRL
jgi:hypothetical protein